MSHSLHCHNIVQIRHTMLARTHTHTSNSRERKQIKQNNNNRKHPAHTQSTIFFFFFTHKTSFIVTAWHCQVTLFGFLPFVVRLRAFVFLLFSLSFSPSVSFGGRRNDFSVPHVRHDTSSSHSLPLSTYGFVSNTNFIYS